MSTKTVFVIGAGASQEVDLPTGYELKSKISRLLNIRFDHDQISGDYVITNSLRELVKDPSGRRGDINPYLHEAWHIRDALPLAISIDNFIDNQRENEKIALCGKLAIARSILEAEKKSKLFFGRFDRNPEINFGTIEDTWYLSFFQLITENCDVSELVDRFKSIKLIIFNYDRCVEHFLFHALQKYYKISEPDAVSMLNTLTIHHPYGSVGQLPWYRNGSPIEFGIEPTPKQLLEITGKIKTFTEGTDPNESDIVLLKEDIFTAQRLVFIGFAFHKLNMELLTPKPNIPPKNKPRCYASTFGISDSDKKIIKGQVSKLYQSTIDLEMANTKCKDFFSEFWRSLSF
jgi:hypothetical protein